MKLSIPPTIACSILHFEPISRRCKSTFVLTRQCHRRGQASKPVGTKSPHAVLAGKPCAQAGNRLLERSLRAQRGSA